MPLVGVGVLETCRFVGETFEESAEVRLAKPSLEEDVDDPTTSLLGLSWDRVAKDDDT